MTQQAQNSTAYIYRYRKLSKHDLFLLLEHIFTQQACFAYVSNYRELRPIQAFASVAELEWEGELGLAFEQGQIFNRTAEVRWKLNGQHYDVLLLTEEDSLGDGLFMRKSLGQYRYHPKKEIKQLLTPEQPDQKQKRLIVREYYADNLAVIWSRYIGLEEGGE